MSEGSSFSSFFGGGCGMVMGIFAAILAIGLLFVGGCVVLTGGCVAVVGTAAKEAADEAQREAERKQQLQEEQSVESPEVIRESVESPQQPELVQPPDAKEPSPSEAVPDEKQPEAEPTPPAEPPKPAVNPNLRTWKDKSGEHSIEAEFVSMAMSKVKLKKADGKIITIPLENLCDEDREWIRKRGR